jgi:hypothetical protein
VREREQFRERRRTARADSCAAHAQHCDFASL